MRAASLLRFLLLVVGSAVLTGCPFWNDCPSGQVPHCQSGPKYGTQCRCI